MRSTDAVVNHISTLPWFYIHRPSVHRKYMTHLTCNTATPSIHFNVCVRDPQLLEGVASRCTALEKTGSRLTIHHPGWLFAEVSQWR